MQIFNISAIYRRIIGNNTLKTLENTIFLTLAEIIVKIISFIWIVYLARTLLVSEFGTYNYVNSFIIIFALLPDLGTGLIVIREIAKTPKKAPSILGNSFFLSLLLSFATFLFIITSALLFGINEQIKLLIIIASFTLFTSTMRSIGIFYLEGTERMKLSAVLNALNTILLIILGYLGFRLGFGLSGIFIGMLIGTMISLFVTWFFTSRYVKPKFNLDKNLIILLLKSGIPLGLAGIASVIYLRIDTIIIGQLLDQASVGIYSAATPFLLSIIQLTSVPFMIAVYPVLTRIYKKDKKTFKIGIIKSSAFILIITLPITIFIFLFSGYLIPLIFGDEYYASVHILKILILSLPFISLSALLYKVLIILNKQITYLFISLLGVAINILLNLYLISKLMLAGAAWAVVATNLILFIFFSYSVFNYVNKK